MAIWVSRKTLKINQTYYYSIQNELPKWRQYLLKYVQNRTPYPTHIENLETSDDLC